MNELLQKMTENFIFSFFARIKITAFTKSEGILTIAEHNRNTQSPWHGAKHYGLDTSVKVHFSNAVHNTTMAINLAKAVSRK